MSKQWFMIHASEDPYAFPVGPGLLKLRLFVQSGQALICTVVHADRYDSPGSELPVEMERIGSAGSYDIHEAVIQTSAGRSRYSFHVADAGGDYRWFGERGMARSREHAGVFQYAYIHRTDALQLPAWVPGSVAYQIYPSSYYQGNLQGISAKMPYLRELGVTLVYLTPIFTSPSEHKYNTSDYYTVDRAFGDLQDLRELVQSAHQEGIRIILDAVFNHSGDTFFAFQDVLEHGENSAYKDWFFVRSYPVTQTPELNYETFAKAEAYMPKLNMNHPEAADYMLAVAKYWVRETGIDGWRLDVANEVHPQFWTRLRRELKAEWPDLLLIGEIMHASGPWLRGDQFDGGMNYLLRDSMLEFFAEQSAGPVRFMEQLLHLEALYNDQANTAMFQLLGSHDTLRFMTACKESGRGWDIERTAGLRMRLAVFFQMTYLGVPMIYYGDEVGMEGATDPHCRKPMLWEGQDEELLQWYRRMITLRRNHRVLQQGSFRPWFTDEPRNTFGYIRRSGQDKIGLMLNNSPNTYRLKLPRFRSDKQVLTDLLTGTTIPNTDLLEVEIEPFGCLMWS
ncbi:alpha amylase N-terminal ig-like domain-containing protein [Paenibacillus sp. MMS20-IR301]|uniref:alpha amylase N-terminal ig-like domain-containing protein n=1 Tax=Paenibacillus sp. MMS20-IR301 TaxID=2895946 RepID=UPI0028ED29F3|nr:alpha amylase N-terminal ig-like domain-containing protein [Paenibacillus sp. MMS20-IR301]WNS43627.1 alpha amylase N-terminal ig-like domain-containing protein [Paenibacillus sp. MMS20-IR301]